MADRIIRVFPRRTNATPDDELAVVDRSPGWFDQADEVHVSVAFTWDLRRAEVLTREWRAVAPVEVGGPATGVAGGEFVPGRYLRLGYTLTSRGCPNRCWFCSVWRREGGTVRELPVRPGWNVLDDNLLACSDGHIREVFAMLAAQARRPEFTGGLEAKRLQPWHAEALRKLRPKQVFFAYDTADDYEPLIAAGRLMFAAGFTATSHVLRCYVLCGYPGDQMAVAENRLRQTVLAGFVPMAMLWRNQHGDANPAWQKFQRSWARPAAICASAGTCGSALRVSS